MFVPHAATGTLFTSASQFFRQIGSTIGLAVFWPAAHLKCQPRDPQIYSQYPRMESQKFDLGSS
ncbi:MAG: hypothetical protein R2880_04955 [Deinococcales bacterium]